MNGVFILLPRFSWVLPKELRGFFPEAEMETEDV